MKPHYKGIIIANNTHDAKNGLDRMRQLFSIDEPPRHLSSDYLVITRGNFNTAGRGCQIGNRIIVFDLSPQAIPDALWEAIIPCIMRDGIMGDNRSQLNVTYIIREERRFDTISDHPFTVRRQDGIGPYPSDLPCARMVDGQECGQRADQHRAIPLARGAQDMITVALGDA